PLLEIFEPDTIVAGEDFNVTCQLRVPLGMLTNYTLLWDVSGLPSSKVKTFEMQEDTTVVNMLSMSRPSAEDLYKKEISCTAIMPPEQPTVTGPTLMIATGNISAVCTAVGALGPQPEITWQDGHGTTIADNWTVREAYDSRIPFWNATIDLNVPYNGTLDFMEFTCTVRQNGTDTEISVLYNVSLLVLELEIDEPDRIVAGQDVNVTCRLKLVSSYLEDFSVDWDIRSLPRSKVQMRESTRGEELVNELTIRHMAVEDLYEKTIVCEATGPADSDSVRAEWKPTGILAAPPEPVVKGPSFAVIYTPAIATCTSTGALGPQPDVVWRTGAGENVTGEVTAETMENAGVHGIPFWNVTAVLDYLFEGSEDVVEFTCTVTHNATNTSITTSHAVSLMGLNGRELRNRHDSRFLVDFTDVVQNKGLRRSALATLDYKLPELDTGELHSDKLSSRWAFHSGRIQFFDPSYYWAFKVYAACVGSILLFVMVMFGAFTYLRRVNEHCYCC
ncbi:hypothetical protein BaRGS_00028642, partial [Batillaria attramentaria]